MSWWNSAQEPGAEALVTAASLLRRLAKVNMEQLKETPTVEVDKDAPAGTKALDEAEKAPDLDVEATKLFEEAHLKGAKFNMDALINDASTREIKRSPIGGPRLIVRRIGPHQTATFNVTLYTRQPTSFGFQATAPMRVHITGGKTTWLNGVGAVAGTTWFPAGAGNTIGVSIKIHNPHKAANQYQFFLN